MMYILSANDYEYNDNTYDLEGTTPLFCSTSKEDLISELNRRLLSGARTGEFNYLFSYHLIIEDKDKFTKHFGYDLELIPNKWNVYHHLKKIPDFEEWPGEKIIKFFEYFNVKPFVIQEVKELPTVTEK